MYTPASTVFRRSWLVVAWYWGIVTGIWLLLELAAHDLGLENNGYALVWALPAALWAMGWTLQWSFHTFTATENGHLIVQRGVVARHRQIIHLCSVQDLGRVVVSQRMGLGHISFKATDDTGQLQSFHWTWIDCFPQLYRILKARGRLSLGQQPHQRCTSDLDRRHSMEAKGRAWTNGGSNRSMQARSLVTDYRRFLETFHLVLRTEDRTQWLQQQISPSVAEVWMTMLVRAGVVLPASNSRGWRVAKDIRSVRDLSCLISEEEFRKALSEQHSEHHAPRQWRRTRQEIRG